MTKTKSGFLKAGSIIAIVMAAFIAMFGLILVASAKIIDSTFVIESVFETKIENIDIIENADGSITYKNPATGERMEEAAVEEVLSLTKITTNSIACYCVGMAIASFVIAILNLVSTAKEKSKNGLIITQLVLSIFTANILTFAFMIVALCLKDKKEEEIKVEQVAA